jgi:hypothetical protein
MSLPVEEIDLAALAAALERAFTGKGAPTGYVEGRTAIRDAVTEHLGCSELEAELLVDTMVSEGFLRFEGDPAGLPTVHDAWRILVAGP